MIIGQNPGADEVREGRPYVGKTGQVMEREYFPAAQLLRGENVSIGNTLRCRWRGTNEMPQGDILRQAVAHCTRAHLRIPPATKLIVAQGAHAWRALGNETAITDWRGFLSPIGYSAHTVRAGSNIPVLGVLHLADLFRNPIMRLPSLRDWSKIPQILAGAWPKPVPSRWIWDGQDEIGLQQAYEALGRHSYVVIDTEYSPNYRIWLMALSGPHAANGLQWFVGTQGFEAWRRHLHTLVRTTTTVFQNVIADIRSLRTTFGIADTDYFAYEDIMLAHAVLWSELPHTLEFIASLYSPYNKLKHLAAPNPALYNWGDVIDTDAAWGVIKTELEKDV